jgi:hypothetical protein
MKKKNLCYNFPYVCLLICFPMKLQHGSLLKNLWISADNKTIMNFTPNGIKAGISIETSCAHLLTYSLASPLHQTSESYVIDGRRRWQHGCAGADPYPYATDRDSCVTLRTPWFICRLLEPSVDGDRWISLRWGYWGEGSARRHRNAITHEALGCAFGGSVCGLRGSRQQHLGDWGIG